MSQVETVNGTIGTSRRHALKERVEAFLKTFEWTWTNAVTFCLVLTFFTLVTTSVIPSFWLYFADQKLRWDGGSAQQLLFWNIDGFWLKELRDAIAMGLVTGPLITVLVLGAIMQNWRRKLRGGGGSRPTGGYR
jgi:hypothetical protein